jgi:hypothetical protein
MAGGARTPRQDAVVNYFAAADSGRFPAELFADGFEFYVAKYGVGHGLNEFVEMVTSAGVKQIKHHVDELLLIEQGNAVAVEGTTEGVTDGGVAWRGGETPAGRFASIFVFNDDGLITRMNIYADPDFAGEHAQGFRWNRAASQKW